MCTGAKDAGCGTHSDGQKLFALTFSDHGFSSFYTFAKLGLPVDPLGIELFRGGARHDADNVLTLACALINDRFDCPHAMSDEDEATITSVFEVIQRPVRLKQTGFQVPLSSTAEFG